MTMMLRLLNLRGLLNRSFLAGRGSAEADLPTIRAALSSQRPVVAVFDFAGVGGLTSSYFVALFSPFLSKSETPSVFPVFANCSLDYQEDIELAARAIGVVVWTATADGQALSSPEPVGSVLDSPNLMILRRVRENRRITASDIFADDKSLIVTAWSNRLALLYQMRLLAREKDGRRIVYMLPWDATDG